MIIRLDPSVKNKLALLAAREGKTPTQVVHEQIDRYIRERDTSVSIDDLWERTQRKLASRGAKSGNMVPIIRSYRAD
jgi:predicted DNA-binding protein